jgi:hypothetical protein
MGFYVMQITGFWPRGVLLVVTSTGFAVGDLGNRHNVLCWLYLVWGLRWETLGERRDVLCWLQHNADDDVVWAQGWRCL